MENEEVPKEKKGRKYGKNIRSWGGTQRNGLALSGILRVEEGDVAQSPWGRVWMRIGMELEYT